MGVASKRHLSLNPDRGHRRFAENDLPVDSAVQLRAHQIEHGAEHVFGQPAGIGVVARAMVAVGEYRAARYAVQRAVREFPGGFLVA